MEVVSFFNMGRYRSVCFINQFYQWQFNPCPFNNVEISPCFSLCTFISYKVNTTPGMPSEGIFPEKQKSGQFESGISIFKFHEAILGEYLFRSFIYSHLFPKFY